MPGCLLSRYSPVPGVSVPFCCVTRYCSGESLEMASGSLLNFLISFSSFRTCLEGTPRVRAALTVEATARLCRGQRLKKIYRISGYSQIAQDTGIASTKRKVVERPAKARSRYKELQAPPHTPFKACTLRSLSSSKYNYHPRTCGTTKPV